MDSRAAVDNSEKVPVIIVEEDGGRRTYLASDYQPGMVLAADSFIPEGYVSPAEADTGAKGGKAGKSGGKAPALTPTPPETPALKLSAPLSWNNGAFTAIDEVSAKAFRVDQNGNVLIKEPFETAELAAAATV